MHRHTWLLALSLGAALPAAAADAVAVYKWVDADGVTHYGEVAPSGGSSERIDLQPAPSAATPPATDVGAIVDLAERLERQRLQRERQRAELDAAQRQAERQDAEQAAAMAGAEFYGRQAAQPTMIYPLRPPHRYPPPHSRPPKDKPAYGFRGNHDPAFTPPERWLRSNPRLLRQEQRARRDGQGKYDWRERRDAGRRD